MDFFIWHYTKWLALTMGITKDLLRFLFDFFSVGELSGVLFSPWYRDVSQRCGQEFNPAHSVRLVVENGILRCVGGGVRLLLIILCGVLSLFLFGMSFLLLCIWIVFPMAFLVLFGVGLFEGNLVYVSFAPVILLPLIFSFAGYEKFRVEKSSKEPDAFLKDSNTRRILDRFEVFLSFEELQNIQSHEEFLTLLKKWRVRYEDFKEALAWETVVDRDREERTAFWHIRNLRKVKSMARRWKIGSTPHIDRYGNDIVHTKEYKELRMCVHSQTLESVKMILSRPKSNCVLLVAPTGSGKRSLVHFLAKQCLEREEDVFSRGTRFVKIDLNRVLASKKSIECGLKVLEGIFEEAAVVGNCILVLEEADRYFGKDFRNKGKMNIVSILAKYLSIPNFRCVITVSTQGFHTSVEQSEALLNLLEVVEFGLMSDTMALRVLLDEFDRDKEEKGVFTFLAIQEIIQHSVRLYPATLLPERALTVAKEVLAYWKRFPFGEYVTKKTVGEFLAFKTGVALEDVPITEKEKWVRFEGMLSERVIGQTEAVKQTVQTLKCARTRANKDLRPVASFLFLGVLGSGKTEFANILTKTYFGKTGTMIRLDMGDYQNEHSVDRLIGSHGSNMPGQLSLWAHDTVRGILFLDRIEKANPKVLDIFLQILNEGFFTDSLGKRVSFSHCMIVASSTVGASVVKNRLAAGADAERAKKEALDYMMEKNIFRSEFLNCFDGVIFFRTIEGEDLLGVCRVLLEDFSKSMKQKKGIKVSFGEDVYREILRSGYDSELGIRSVSQFIAKKVEPRMANLLAVKNLERGERVHITLEDIR